MNCNCNCSNVSRAGLLPHHYYRKKCQCYVMELETKNRIRLWGMHSACDNSARELYAHSVGRPSNVTCLTLTIKDADELFEHFKVFANVWVYRITLQN